MQKKGRAAQQTALNPTLRRTYNTLSSPHHTQYAAARSTQVHPLCLTHTLNEQLLLRQLPYAWKEGCTGSGESMVGAFTSRSTDSRRLGLLSRRMRLCHVGHSNWSWLEKLGA